VLTARAHSFATLAVALSSSAYSGATQEMGRELGGSSEVITLGISLFVLGFAIGEPRSLRACTLHADTPQARSSGRRCLSSSAGATCSSCRTPS
jgi:hypothetical protein